MTDFDDQMRARLGRGTPADTETDEEPDLWDPDFGYRTPILTGKPSLNAQVRAALRRKRYGW